MYVVWDLVFEFMFGLRFRFVCIVLNPTLNHPPAET